MRPFSLQAMTCFALLSLVSGCVETESPESLLPIADARSADNGSGTQTSVVAAQSSAASMDGRTAKFAGIRFTVPAGWTKVPLNEIQRGIIAAKYEIPAADPGVSLTCSSVGGGIEANIERWRGQFGGGEFDSESIPVGGTTATLVDLRGRFSPGFGRGPQDDWRMLGVAIPIEPREFYVKLTGPRSAVGEVEDEFRDFLRSGRTGGQ